MKASLLGAALAFIGGALIALVNDRLTRAAYNKAPERLSRVFPLRQLINLAYLAAVFFLAPLLPWEAAPLLLGGALGLTVPSVLLALRFAKGGRTEKSAGEGEDKNG